MGAAFGLLDVGGDTGLAAAAAGAGGGGGGGGGGGAAGDATNAIMTGTSGRLSVAHINGTTNTTVTSTTCPMIDTTVAPAELRRYGLSTFSRTKSNMAPLPHLSCRPEIRPTPHA